MLSGDGRLYVHADLKISGNVDFETGHVDFNGHIEVNGRIKDGFNIKGGSLLCREIMKSTIEVTGDVTVLGGIIGGTIKAGGNVRARYVQQARIEALGEVVVENEIRHSRVITSGTCISAKGSILDSWVAAKYGIESLEVGSESSSPSSLLVGLDVNVRTRVEEIRMEIEEREAGLEKRRLSLSQVHAQADRLSLRMGELAEVWDRADMQIMLLKLNLPKLAAPADAAKRAKVAQVINQLEDTQAENRQHLEKLLDKQEPLIDDIGLRQAEIDLEELAIKELKEEIERLIEYSQADINMARVKVSGTIQAETRLQGIHANTQITATRENVTLREVRRILPGGREQWTFEAIPNA